MKKSIVKSFLKASGLLSFLKGLRSSFNYEYQYKLNSAKIKGLKIYSAKTENGEKWMGQLLKVLLELKRGGGAWM